ncbi:type IV pilus modification PilV family protein [Candidatus Colwellia aromaticivorans]|uniref:type IV pilus modification PilV family protein n=1 Tax=Candidatus Colwellia aromaticivorans TaxID=2267621 RepID=UPI000DF1CE73|nr:prepilin-type N-terminal cleavage/methylation domain-containing protein [Candidatus Colwellia aromaticivorans]
MSYVVGNKVTGIKKLTKSNQGFTLIEVLIGIFIAAVGIVGVLEIQKHVIRSGNEVNARTIAIQLVRDKLDFINNIDAFDDVGRDLPDVENNMVKNNYSFTRSWTMTAHHFDEDAATWGVVGTGESTDAKHVTVSVSWTDINNNVQTVNGDQIISSASIHDTSGLSTTSGDRITPEIPFNEISSIENPPISLVDDVIANATYNTQETSRPIPTVVARNGQNLIQFETITYDNSSDQQTLEDFSTVNCSCSFSANGEAKAPTILTISNDGESLINDENSGELISKVKGVTSSTGQPELCTACCEDHHDSSSSAAKYVSGSSADHPHYDTDLNEAFPPSDDYVEACRFRRVDGFYEMVPDWQLADIIIMPKSYFVDTDNVTAYVSYVKAVVQAKLMGTTMPTKLDIDTRSMTDLLAGGYQLIARGIYVDLASLSSTDLTTIQSYGLVGGSDYKPNWLAYVPFYEINLSLFADWSTDPNSSAVATITNEAIDTIVDPATNYYGNFSRGWLTALETGAVNIVGEARTDNTGLTGSGAIVSPSSILSDTINVDVNIEGISVDCQTVGCSNSISININCINDNGTRCTGQDGSNINLISSAGLACTNLDGETTTPSYNGEDVICNGVSDAWTSGSITLSEAGYKFYFPPASDSPTAEEIAAAVASAQIDLVVPITIDTVGVGFSRDVIMLEQ